MCVMLWLMSAFPVDTALQLLTPLYVSVCTCVCVNAVHTILYVIGFEHACMHACPHSHMNIYSTSQVPNLTGNWELGSPLSIIWE